MNIHAYTFICIIIYQYITWGQIQRRRGWNDAHFAFMAAACRVVATLHLCWPNRNRQQRVSVAVCHLSTSPQLNTKLRNEGSNIGPLILGCAFQANEKHTFQLKLNLIDIKL